MPDRLSKQGSGARMGTLAGVVLFAAGCAALPSALRPPTAPSVAAQGAPSGTVDLSVAVSISADPLLGAQALAVGSTPAGRVLGLLPAAGSNLFRRVQYNGPGGSPANNDIADLLVGLFDNGTGVMSLGYVYSGPAGSATTATALSSAPGYLADLETRLGTVGTTNPGTDSTYTITGDKANLRRYLIRDYGAGTGWTSASSTTTFTDIPAPTGSSGAHSYLVFCAAYDSLANNLGYAETAVPIPANPTSANVQTALTLNLSEGILGPGGTLTETPTLVPFIPSAQ